MPTPVHVLCHGISDRGLVRSTNEDQFLIGRLHQSVSVEGTSLANHERLIGRTHGYLLLVADGMGGHAAGEHASSIAVKVVERFVLHTMDWFFHLRENYEDDLLDELKAALLECQNQIEADQAVHPEHGQMGTTLTMAYILWPRVFIVHAGDSRCYLLREGTLAQITTDHTVAQQYVEAGRLTQEEAEGSRWSHLLWNAVGGSSSQLYPEVHKGTLLFGDTLFLCTDGISKYLDHEAIRTLLGQGLSPEQACQELVARANAAGGSDNITAVVAQFSDVASATSTTATVTW